MPGSPASPSCSTSPSGSPAWRSTGGRRWVKERPTAWPTWRRRRPFSAPPWCSRCSWVSAPWYSPSPCMRSRAGKTPRSRGWRCAAGSAKGSSAWPESPRHSDCCGSPPRRPRAVTPICRAQTLSAAISSRWVAATPSSARSSSPLAARSFAGSSCARGRFLLRSPGSASAPPCCSWSFFRPSSAAWFRVRQPAMPGCRCCCSSWASRSGCS